MFKTKVRGDVFDIGLAYDQVAAKLMKEFHLSVEELGLYAWLFEVGANGRIEVRMPERIVGGDITMSPSDLLRIFVLPKGVPRGPVFLKQKGGWEEGQTAAYFKGRFIYVCWVRTGEIAKAGAKYYAKIHTAALKARTG